MKLCRSGWLARRCTWVGAVSLFTSAPAFAMLPPPSQPLGACTPEMVRAEELFPQAGGLRVVVARFVGQDAPSEKMGAELAYTLSQELPEYTRKSLRDDAQAAGLRGDEMQVQYVPCLMSSHSQARQVGKAWGADLLFWGQASCSSRDPLNCKLSPVVEKGAQVTVQVKGDVRADKGNVRIGINDNRHVTVVAPPPSGLFKTSVTLVRWRGLQCRSDQSVRVDPAAATDLDFPRLASERPLALFRWAVGVYAFYSQKYALAAARFEESEDELYAGVEDRSGLYRVIGTSYMYAGIPQRGIQALEQARASCTGSDARCQGAALVNLGWAEARLGNKPKALSYFDQALQLKKQGGDRSGEATTLNNIGLVYSALGDKPKALSYFDQALQLKKQVGDRSGEASTLNNIGLVYSALGDKPKALSYYEQALLLKKQVGDHLGEATTLSNIGDVYAALGDKPRALSYYEQALLLKKQGGDRSDEATTLNNIGIVYSALGDKPKALSYYEQALQLKKQGGDRSGEATTLNNIGRVYDALGDKPKALSYYEQALPMRKQVGDRSGEATTLRNIGLVYSALGDKPRALSYFEQALQLRKQMGDRSGEGVVLDNLAAVLAELSQPLQSIARYREASLCYLARRPPDTPEAVGRLRLAFGVALRSKLWPQAATLLSEMEGLKPPAVLHAQWRAQLAGHSGAVDAAARYQELYRLAAALPGADQARVQSLAKAGDLRTQQRAYFADCLGVVITRVLPDSQAARLGFVNRHPQGTILRQIRQGHGTTPSPGSWDHRRGGKTQIRQGHGTTASPGSWDRARPRA